VVVLATLGLSSCTNSDERAFEIPLQYYDIPEYGVTSRLGEPEPMGQEVIQYLVHFPNPDDPWQFDVVDSAMMSALPEPCDDNAISYVAGSGDCRTICMMRLPPTGRHDTVATICGYGREHQRWFTSATYRHADSLLVLCELVAGATGLPRNRVVILGVEMGTIVDTIAILDPAMWPTISTDGTEVFCTQPAFSKPGEFSIGRLIVYDRLGDSTYLPFSDDCNVSRAVRRTRDEPLYFVLNEPQTGTNIWSWSPGQGKRQVTRYQPPLHVRAARIDGGSLRFELHEPDRPNAPIHKKAIPLGPRPAP
jgi:hypothetical protein